MAIEVNGKTIETDDNGNLANPQDWNEDVAKALAAIDDIQMVGDLENHAPLLSFNLAGIHPHDVAGFLNEAGIAIRAGHHCTQPLMDLLGIQGTCRISLAVYNTRDEIDRLKEKLNEVRQFFK